MGEAAGPVSMIRRQETFKLKCERVLSLEMKPADRSAVREKVLSFVVFPLLAFFPQKTSTQQYQKGKPVAM